MSNSVRERIEFADEDVQIVTAMIRNAFQEIQMAARLGDPEAVGDVENRVAKAVLECARARVLDAAGMGERDEEAR